MEGALARESMTFAPGMYAIPPGIRLTLTAHRYQPVGGRFAAAPVFNADGFASVVFLGGGLDLLEGAAARACARGVWVQDARGDYDVLIVGGPAWWKRMYIARFPLKASTSVTLVRQPGECATVYPDAP